MRILPTLTLLAFAMPVHALGPLNDTGVTTLPGPDGQDRGYGADAAAAAGVRYKVGGSAGTLSLWDIHLSHHSYSRAIPTST